MKRWIAVFLTLVMILSLSVAAGAYQDVAESAPYAEAVAAATEAGLLNGVGDGNFDPDGLVTRAQVVTVLGRAAMAAKAEAVSYTDVASGSWYSGYVGWAEANGIVTSAGNGLFRPEDPVTGAELTAMLQSYANYQGADYTVASLSGNTVTRAQLAQQLIGIMSLGKWGEIDLSLTRPLAFADTDVRDFARGDEAYYAPYADADVNFYYYRASTWSNARVSTCPVYTYYTVYTDEAGAKAALVSSGLRELAEETGGVVVIATALEGTYSAKDVEVYKAIEQWLLFEHLHTGTKNFGPGIVVDNYFSYTQRDFVVSDDKAAADFVASTLPSYPNRLTGVVLLGATKAGTRTDVPVPAYLCDCSNEVVDYFKTVNKATDPWGEDGFINPTEAAQKVIVATGKTVGEAAREMWEKSGYNTYRPCYSSMIFAPEGKGTDAVFALAQLPIPEDLGVTVETVTDASTCISSGAITGWVIYQSEYMVAHPEEKYPVIFVFHGAGTSPEAEAENDGFVALTAEENVMVVSMEYEGSNIAESGKEAISYILANYPADPTRVFATGFSAGGVASGNLVANHPELFAGYICMHSNNGIGLPGSPNADLFPTNNVTVPFMLVCGTLDEASIRTEDLLKPTLERWGAQNKVTDIDFTKIPQEDFHAAKLYGTSMETAQRVDHSSVAFLLNTFHNAAGQPVLRVAAAQDVVHTCHAGLARTIWDYMVDFSRVDGTPCYQGAPIEG